MARVDDFDAFYHATRRPLLHQTYALTGDVERAVGGVEHAYAYAWSQWRKVRHVPDPVAWVRAEAWQTASGPGIPRRRRRSARRRSARSTARTGPSAHADTLAALTGLSDGQRRAVLLHHLAELPVERLAREVGVSDGTGASLLRKGEQGWAAARPGARLDAALTGLEEDLVGVDLRRGSALRRYGDKRQRQHTLAGVATATALLVGGGMLIADDGPAGVQQASAQGGRATEAPQPGDQPRQSRPTQPAQPSQPPAHSARLPRTPEAFLLDPDALLTANEMGRLTQPAGEWSVRSTTDGTTGDPVYAPCQREPFADPDGNQALLRRYESKDQDTRLRAVQVIEESRSTQQAAKAFQIMEDWYARCSDDGVQLLSTLSVRGLGDEARAFRLRDFGRRDTYLTVGIVRTGPVTTAVVASTRADEPVSVRRVLDRAGVSVTRMCLAVSGDCSTHPEVTEAAPLPTEEHPGFLAAFDLPKVSGVAAPWVGTDPSRARRNTAATPCERADLGRAQHPRTRVFVLPTAKRVPRRFGLAETVGTFGTRAAARGFMQRAYASAEDCPDRELSASQPRPRELPGGLPGRTWRFEFEVTEDNSVYYRVGLTRAGSRVALLSMSPSRSYDVSPGEFSRLTVRAHERLLDAEPRKDSTQRPADGASPPDRDPKRR